VRCVCAVGMAKQSPKIIEMTVQQVEELLDRIASNTLREEDTELVLQIFQSYLHLVSLLGNKNTTIARLRKMLFGGSEKTKDVLGDDDTSEDDDNDDTEEPNSATNDDSDDELTDTDDSESNDYDEPTTPMNDGPDDGPDDGPKDEPDAPNNNGSPDGASSGKAPGHGRYGADDYPGAGQVEVKHSTLAAGDACPECLKGTLYEKIPGVLVRFVGQAPLQATVYRMQKLRCHVCGKIFTASVPEGVGSEKYDHTVASMIGLLKYGSGLPFNRLQRLQGNCEIPLAASTQWKIVHAAASEVLPAYEELTRQAAQGEVVYNDDTPVKILELMGERLKKSPPLDDEHDPGRTGLFTTGVVATRSDSQHGTVRIALFFSGRQHAGENLSDVLKYRAAELDAPIQMSDGLARNLPKDFETIVASCLVHGRRNFVEVYDRFPDECRYVIEAFKVVYFNDKVAREGEMSAEERLSHHQTHSQQAMDDLKAWMQRQFEEKLVEPNSALGEAINYLLKRWDSLTLFLRKAGAPLDNNICERALKKAILHRKNSLFYRSRKGALVGDIFMSLIYTCELSGVNALDYLNQLQLNASDVASHPDRWMPWNYHENLAVTANAA